MLQVLRLLPVVVIFASACNPDQGFTTFNRPPRATIDSHSDGAQVSEGYPIPFRGTVSDQDNRVDELYATWLLDGREACPAAQPDASGVSTCDIVFPAGESTVTLEVRDSGGERGAAEVIIEATPTEAPTIQWIDPDPNQHVFYADGAVSFHAVVADAEDAPPDLSVTWHSDLDGDLDLPATPEATGDIRGSTFLTEGDHTLVATVTDLTGKTATASQLVTIHPPDSPPQCAITAPGNDSIAPLGQALEFEGTATDPDVQPTWLTVTWTSDKDGLLGTSTPGSDGTVLFPWNGLSVNSHAITMTVTDDAGKTCTDSIVVTVGTPPLVSILSPQPNRIYAKGTPVTFTAKVLDNEDASTALDLEWSSSIDGVIGANRADANGDVTFQRDDLSNGWHDLTLTVTDTLGLVSTDTVHFKVNLPPVGPVVSIDPADAHTTDDLTVAFDVPSTDPDGDPVSYTYQWFKNGAVAAAHTSSSVPAADTAKHQTWRVVVTPSDGTADGPTGEASLEVRNSPPTVSGLSIPGSGFTETSTLSCDVATVQDADGDSVNLAYAWTVDGNAVAATSRTLDGTWFDKGQQVACLVTGVDDEEPGQAAASNTVTIDDTPPSVSNVTILPPDPEADSTITCTYSFSDVDGDPDHSSVAWQVNGTDAGTGSTLGAAVAVDDTITCTVTPSDGQASGTPANQNATIVQSAPTITGVTITPPDPDLLKTLTCAVQGYSDPQGDPDQSRFAWTVNGTAAGTGPTLSGAFERDDAVVCTATPSDGTHAGTPQQASLVIGNAPPGKPTSQLTPALATVGGQDLVCTVIAPSTDPDGDTVSYHFDWTVAGVPFNGAIDHTLDSHVAGSDLGAYQTWVCTVTPDDGIDTGPSASKNVFTVPPIEPQVATGGTNTCYLDASGALQCWGADSFHQSEPPSAVYRQVTCGEWHCCGIKAVDSTLVCWGDNRYRQVVDTPSGQFIDVAAGWYHSCAVGADHKIACWGSNFRGQMDAPSGSFERTAAGAKHSCGLSSSGSITCWGDSGNNRLNVPAGSYIDLDAGTDHTCAIDTTGTAVCWGATGQGRCNAPTGVTFVDIAAGDAHGCGVLADHSVTCWGADGSGQATAPTTGSYDQVDAGYLHSCAVGPAGYTCWGDDSSGQLAP